MHWIVMWVLVPFVRFYSNAFSPPPRFIQSTTGACRALQRLYLRSACLPDSGVHELVAALQASSSSVGEKLQVRGGVWE